MVVSAECAVLRIKRRRRVYWVLTTDCGRLARRLTCFVRSERDAAVPVKSFSGMNTRAAVRVKPLAAWLV
jgi:hypothetical protein